MSVYIAAERRLTSPVMSTGEKRSTLPVSFTCAREFGAEESPLMVPLSSTMPAAKFGSMEKSAKLVLPFSIETVPMRIGIGAGALAAAAVFGAGGGGIAGRAAAAPA